MKSQRDVLPSQILWLISLRTVIVSFVLLFTILTHLKLKEGAVLLPLQLTGLYFTCGVAYLLTFIYSALYRLLQDKPLFAYIQLMVDNLLISLIVVITGGVGSLFSALYFLTIISASMLLFRRGGVLITIQSVLFYLASIYIPFLYRFSPWLDLEGRYQTISFSYVSYRGIVYVAAMLVVFLLTSYLTESLRLTGEALIARESDLAELQTLNENILQSIGSGLITTDMEGRIVSFNRAAEKIIGRSADECRGRYIQELVNFQSELSPFHEGSRGQFRGKRFEGTLADMETVVLGMTFSPLKDDSGKITGVICSFQDLTEIKKMEEQIKMSDRLAAVGELAAGVAHEIRNPLASISGSIQVMKEDSPLDEQTLGLMNIVTREAERLNDIISDFLSFASPRSLQLEPVSLNDLLDETLTLLRKSTAGRSEKYDFSIENEIQDKQVSLDPQLIKQVFWNLSLNAIQAMPEGGWLKIRINRESFGDESYAEREFVIVEFIDTGDGIESSQMEKLFTPFYSTKENGTGLGLPIVFKVVEQHQGSIEIESQPGEGSVIRLKIPADLDRELLKEVQR
jgi:two-component system sensor histidine kinase PilS (NtrC family)